MTLKLSPNFTLEEMIHSESYPDIPNYPVPLTIDRLRALAFKLEEVRLVMGSKPIVLSSGYRSQQLNSLVRGSENSDHMRGDAADFTCPQFGTPREIALRIAASEIKFDQLILEPSWVHFSNGPRMRGQVKTKTLVGYANGIIT